MTGMRWFRCFIRSGKIIGRDHFHVRVGSEESMGDILVNFVKQYYSGTPFIPREIMLQEAIEDIPVLEEWLTAKRGRKVTIRIPQKGLKKNWWNWLQEMHSWFSVRIRKDQERRRPHNRRGKRD